MIALANSNVKTPGVRRCRSFILISTFIFSLQLKEQQQQDSGYMSELQSGSDVASALSIAPQDSGYMSELQSASDVASALSIAPQDQVRMKERCFARRRLERRNAER